VVGTFIQLEEKVNLKINQFKYYGEILTNFISFVDSDLEASNLELKSTGYISGYLFYEV